MKRLLNSVERLLSFVKRLLSSVERLLSSVERHSMVNSSIFRFRKLNYRKVEQYIYDCDTEKTCVLRVLYVQAQGHVGHIGHVFSLFPILHTRAVQEV